MTNILTKEEKYKPIKSIENKIIEKSSFQSYLKRIVFDIDETIATRELEDDLVKLEPSNVEWFNKKDLIIEFYIKEEGVNVVCYIHPGTKEFLRFTKELGAELSFFSSGVESINIPFIKKLLIKTFGEGDYSTISNSITFSRQHCDDYNRKNLLLTMQKGETLDRVLLIDDKKTSFPGQEKNRLMIPAAKPKHFNSMTRKNLFRVNHIFYIVGILTKALEIGSEDFLESLNELHKQALSSEKDQLKYCYDGLAILQKINPELEFFCADLMLNTALELNMKEYVIPFLHKGEKIEAITLFQSAAKNNKIEVVEFLMSIGVNINTRYMKLTALTVSISAGQDKMVDILFRYNAYLDLTNREDISAVLSAFKKNSPVLKVLFCHYLSHTTPPDEKYLFANKAAILLQILNRLMNKINNKEEVIIAYENIKNVIQSYSEYKKHVPSIKKIAQMRILAIEYNEEKQDSAPSEKQKLINEENRIKQFLKSSEPYLFKYFKKNHSSYDIYEMIKQKKSAAKDLYFDKQEKFEDILNKKLKNQLGKLPTDQFRFKQ